MLIIFKNNSGEDKWVDAGFDVAVSIDATPGPMAYAESNIDVDVSIDSGVLKFVDADFNLSIDVAVGILKVLDFIDSALSVPIEFEIDSVSTFTTHNAVVCYLFTLTGASDGTTDIEIPISSFQCRMRSGDPTYLSLVIPGVDYASEITARANGILKIDMAYKQDGEYLQRETIVQADLENVALDEGENSASITLTGHKTETFSGKTITLEKSVYRSVKDGKVRHRIAKPNIELRPGDTVTVGSDTFIADTVSYAISVDSKTMEVAEA